MQKERRPGTDNKGAQQIEQFPGAQRIAGPVKNPSLITDPVRGSKERLYFTNHKGSFLKRCPGTPPGYLCCNYYVLNIQTNCNLDCHYCILQSYINNDRITVYTNIDDALDEVEKFLKTRTDRFYRIGTGELTDSLSLDYFTNTSLALIPFFMQFKNALLELKTKSDKIANLLKFKSNSNIVISWSLNPQNIINTYEKRTASLIERLEAARKCSQNGYRIGFHLDPVILYPDWETGYQGLINQIYKYISPDKVVWISIAGFRCSHSLKNIIQERFPATRLFTEEMVRAHDGKHRYLRPIRVVAYRKIISWIKEYDPDVPIYFCMENSAVWRDVFGKLPTEIKNLQGIFGPPVKPVRLSSY